MVERCVNPSASYGDPGNQRTVTTYYPSDDSFAESGRLNSVLYPDGRLDVYTYEYGTYASNVNPAQPGIFTPGSGSDLSETVTHGTAASPWGIDMKTTREISLRNALGNELIREIYNSAWRNNSDFVPWT